MGRFQMDHSGVLAKRHHFGDRAILAAGEYIDSTCKPNCRLNS